MSTEETVTNVGQSDTEQPSTDTKPTTEAATSAPMTGAVSQDSGAAVATQREDDLASQLDDESESRPDQDFGQLLDQFEQEQSSLQEGEVVRGTVVGITERGVVIDFGYKSEGIVNQAEFMEDGQITVKRGDEVDVMVKNMETGEGFPLLSRADAVRLRAWDDLEKAFEEGTSVKGRVAERIKGGLRVDIDGIGAFLPGSQVDVRPVRNLDSLRGREIEAKVIKLNRKRSNVVLSRKAVLEERNADRKGSTLGQIEEDIIVEGQIKNLTDYGAFVDLGGVDGLLHVTDMSWGRLQNPAELFNVGDTVQVKVLRFDRARERVSLGYKQLLPDPWETIDERFPVGTRMTGKVASVTDYGAFVELEPGVEGLVHVSEMSWSKRVKHPSKIVGPGDEVEVAVLGIDPKARRISLGMKQVQENPWRTLSERYQVGARVHGRVRNLTDFGAFIEIEDGVDGLVHVSDISWARRVKHPGEVLKKGQQVDAVITGIDPENRRMSLSIKDLEPNAWNDFVASHKPGDLIKGKIARFASFGAFVELGENLEGLCHISELSDDRVAKPEDAAELGQELEFRILRIDAENKKIGLSARAAGDDEPLMEQKIYTSEAGGGMASLRELADFGYTIKGGGDDKSADEKTTEETSAEDMSAQDASAEEKSVDETGAGETSVDENSAQDTSAEEKSVDETGAGETSVDENSAQDTSAEEKSVDETGAGETSVDENSAGADTEEG